MSSVLFRRADVDGTMVDVRCADGVIAHVGPAGSASGADLEVDADGRALLPGLHDHHLHLFALAAARASIDVGTTATEQDFEDAVRTAGVGPWRRVVGYHETIHGPLDRERLDELAPLTPVRVQHRTGAMWVLNTSALIAVGLEEHRDGRLLDADELLQERIGPEVPDLAAVGRELSTYGVTGVTDLTPTEDAATIDLLADLVVTSDFPLRVTVTGGPGLPPAAGRGLPRGPVKIVLADHRLPLLDEVVRAFGTARRAGRNVAVHCVTRVALALALAAWDEVGVEPGDRVEHGAVIPLELITTLRQLGLTVVTQPAFVAARGDQYLTDVDPDDADHLWRCGTLVGEGVGVAGSTDAPFGPANPWLAIGAAVDRRTATGKLLGVAERVDPVTALRLFLSAADRPAGPPRRVEHGAPADLCLIDRPLASALRDPASVAVVATLGRAGLST